MRARAVYLSSAVLLCDLCRSMYGRGSGDPLGGGRVGSCAMWTGAGRGHGAGGCLSLYVYMYVVCDDMRGGKC